MKVLAVVGAILVAALLAVGCGGGDSEPLTTGEFIEQGNQICIEAAEERGDALKAAAEDSSDESLEEEMDTIVVDTALPVITDMTEELGDLELQNGKQGEVDAIVAAFEEGIKKLEADPELSLGGEPFKAANEKAESYGLTDCVI
jgi:hypothetical protein